MDIHSNAALRKKLCSPSSTRQGHKGHYHRCRTKHNTGGARSRTLLGMGWGINHNATENSTYHTSHALTLEKCSAASCAPVQSVVYENTSATSDQWSQRQRYSNSNIIPTMRASARLRPRPASARPDPRGSSRLVSNTLPSVLRSVVLRRAPVLRQPCPL